MYGTIIRNDIKKQKLITVTIAVFILVAAMLTSLAATLIVNLFGAIDNMLQTAKAPHYMQMHSGDLDRERLERFAETHANVETMQVLAFLNIDGAEMVIGEDTLAWSVQDNGVSTQSQTFDFLLDLNGDKIQPADGEIYVPIYYMKEGAAKLGDAVSIRGVPFVVAGFVRDAQMNSAFVSSKRFLVSENDFEKIRSFGMLEYLIEFQLKDASATAAFESEYMQAGLPVNGPPAITYPLIRMINAITDGIMIAVLMLIGILVILVAFLCIRFTLLTKVEEDYREIGVLKAIGFRVSHLKKLYMAKYGAIVGVACTLGYLVSLLIQEPFMANIRLYLGESDRALTGLLLGFCGAAAIGLVVMLYVNGVLRRFRKISPAQAIRFGAPQEKSKTARGFRLSKNRFLSRNVFLGTKDVLSRKKLYVTMLMVLVICSFMMVVPQNIYNTISAKDFVTYMGIGLCDMRLDIQQTRTDNIPQRTAEIADALEQDERVVRYTVLTSRMFDMQAEDGSIQRFKVDIGDHVVFPVTYAKGRAPLTETEIAISTLNADELEKTVGDAIVLLVDGGEKRLTICGLYADITNGGKTAKAVFQTDDGDILGTSIPVVFADASITEAKAVEYKERFSFAKVSSVDEHIDQMFGSTITAVQLASYVSIAATIVLTILVTLLFMKMLVTKDRYPIAILKSMGFTGADVMKQYRTRAMIVLVLGVLIGTILANTLGEWVGVALIALFGASTFHFKIDPLFAYLFAPLVIAVCVSMATRFGISDIRSLQIAAHIKE